MKSSILRVAIVGVALTLVLTACSSRTADDTPSTDPTGGETSALQVEAQEKVAEYTAQQSYPMPTEAFDPGDFTVDVAGCGFASSVCRAQADEAVVALQAMGYTVGPAFDTQFSPQQVGAFLDRAVQQGVDGVLMYSIDVDTAPEATQRALDAGVTIVCTMCANTDKWEGQVHNVTVDWYEQGVMSAWAMMAEHGDAVKAATFFDNVYRSTVLRSDGLVETLEKECDTCTVEAESFVGSDVAKPGPPQVSALLASTSKGDLTNIAGHYDSFSTIVAGTVAQAGRSEVDVSGYNGESPAVSAIITGEPAPLAFTIGVPQTFSEWLGADLLGRLLSGTATEDDAELLPSTLIDPSNAELYLESDPAPEGDWRAEFKKLWGAQ